MFSFDHKKTRYYYVFRPENSERSKQQQGSVIPEPANHTTRMLSRGNEISLPAFWWRRVKRSM